MACCPSVKLTKAKIVNYNINESKPNVNLNAEQDAADIEDRVTKLRGKLAEAHTNINMLRSWVGEAIDEAHGQKPKSPKELVCELKDLLIKLDQIDELNDVMIERGNECIKLMDELNDQSCICALTSPSCEEIKQQLQLVVLEKDEIDEKIDQLQNGKKEVCPEELLDEVQKELSDVVDACSNWNCPKINKAGKATMETGMQANCCEVSKRPKLMQTVENPKWDQGTNPGCESACCKPKGCC